MMDDGTMINIYLIFFSFIMPNKVIKKTKKNRVIKNLRETKRLEDERKILFFHIILWILLFYQKYNL